ncbi:MAG: polyphenol oxidase family protein [Acidimicrobiales bacterium]
MTVRHRLGPAHVVFTGRAEGDLGHGGAFIHEVRPEVAARRQAVVDLPWTWIRQVHGDTVVRADSPGASAGVTADAVVTAASGAAIAVLTADCAPVVLAGDEGVVGVAHAGWAGLEAGVVQQTVKEVRALGATGVRALIGPCIRPECYAFGEDDLARLVDRYGPAVASRTAGGAPALDLAAGVRSALAEQGVDEVGDVEECTACSISYYSWRARRETARQAAVAWR